MIFFEIKANGRFYDTVFYSSQKTIKEVKKEYQHLLKTEDVKVRRVHSTQ